MKTKIAGQARKRPAISSRKRTPRVGLVLNQEFSPACPPVERLTASCSCC
ncbi:hypothetical protein ACUUL3_05890 [Thiovibrio sp. JS02]